MRCCWHGPRRSATEPAGARVGGERAVRTAAEGVLSFDSTKGYGSATPLGGCGCRACASRRSGIRRARHDPENDAFCQRTTRSGSGFDQRCRHRRTSATSPPSIWSASPTAPACPPTNERTAAVQPSAANPARTRRPATFATPIRSCSASATTSANVGNTVRTAASGRPDRDRTAIERPSRLTHADLVEFSAPEPATVPTMGLLAVTVVAIAAARR